MGLGLLFVWSATYTAHEPYSAYFKKQIFGAVTGLIIYFVTCATDLRSLSRWSYFGYYFVIFLLLYTMIMGSIGLGAKRWISLYFIKFQPSELAKLLLPGALAYYFNEEYPPPAGPPLKMYIENFKIPLIILFTSGLLILKQPDLGTSLIVLFTGMIIFWIIGMPKSFFITGALCCVLGAPLLWTMLKPYQQRRILVLMGQGDVRNERYQIEQARIAIGSGGLTGKGLLKGTQNKFSFLPEDHTDFIFAVVCEEWGFLGAMTIILLFLLLFLRIIYITLQLPALLEQVMAIGLLMHMLLSVCINIGMVTGMLPIVGIPLPLVSYGISYLWVTLASLGILNNIAIRRFYY